MERIKLGSALAAFVLVAPVAHAASGIAPVSGFAQMMPAAYNGDPYSPHKGGGRKAHASKKTPEPPADLSKGETPEQHKAYLKKYGF